MPPATGSCDDRTRRGLACIQHVRPAGGRAHAGARDERCRRAARGRPSRARAREKVDPRRRQQPDPVARPRERGGARSRSWAGACCREDDDAWIVEAGAGETWHDVVAWTLQQGCPGLENLALIPGTVGAAPVQNIGAYGVELKDRFESLDAVDLVTGRSVTLDATACHFAYRDSVFKHSGFGGLAGKSVITRVRLRLPRRWAPVLGYLDLERKVHDTGITAARRADGVRLGVRDPARQAARSARDRQRRQLLQEPGGQRRAVQGHHRARPADRALPAARRQLQAGRGLADRRLRLEGQVDRPRRASTTSRRWCWSTAAAPAAPRC